ncbi:MAG: bifunctional adenosylcobinamide kinase/adenosylcobinamide-phosphate guanylyltransferase [Pseudomonadota bacterium]
MAKSILITGGARSGKSVFAERLTLRLGTPASYIATAEALDGEMADRIAAHQARRGPEWTTHAAPLELVTALLHTDGAGPRLVDCLTLWLSNLVLSDMEWRPAADALAAAIAQQSSPVVFVTNEVGAGLVPETPLGRRYRDAAGKTNQIIAQACDEVYLIVAGQPLRIKPNDSVSV